MAAEESWGTWASLVETAVEMDGTGVCICDMEGAVRYVNRAFLRILGHDETAALFSGKITDLAGEFGEMLAAVQNSRDAVRKTFTVTLKSSAIRQLLCSASLQGNGDARAAVIMVRNLTAEMMGNSGDTWHAIIDNLEDGYYECDLRGNFTVVNNAMCRISEYDQDEFIGMNFSKWFTGEYSDAVYQRYNEVFKTGKPARLLNFTAVTKSGRKKKIELSIALIREADGKIKGFRGIVRDITDKNKMEMELLRARKLEAIGILAGGIAHDYNNVLTAILGNISLAKMEVNPENRSLMEVLNDAEVASLKAVELTRRLSTFARGGKPERRIIDYSESLKSIVDSVLRNYAGRHELVIKDRLWEVEVDEFQIGQVVTYILHNAMESMPVPGLIRITADNAVVEKEASHHEISLQPGNYVRISISDEGVGIPAESIQNIFDPYFTTKEMASGLGLATSYAIIKRHHGYIDVQSMEGKGSTFYVYLPVAH
ncbi:MAG TPA: PAS domain S-box protein [Spirochaetota bacterium]|nr:PAS domain S-box protein [Spirochaetota bacterium]HQH97901.1 PAS domain S-box protein [Spirochaetota bacterium]HQJ72544.1 PAS domain S-box protein [Spirochaetota bacterium]